MAVLHVRNVPDELYRQAQAIAASRGVTLSSLIIEFMQEAAERETARKRHVKAMTEIRRNLAKRPRCTTSGADLVRLVRDEREREKDPA
jgi:hypothetical protein